ncbi:UNVERIFIED_CONTAM: hypothetical protein RMT77_017832 [Armadillidium vulgare]
MSNKNLENHTKIHEDLTPLKKIETINTKVVSETLKIGTRDSELAMKQTYLVMEKLKEHYHHLSFKIESMKTLGDQILDVALSKIGSKSLFTKELEVALVEKHVDIVVHSLKDLPTTLPDGLVIGAVLTRENPCDAVILHSKYKDKSLKTLPEGCLIGTSSLRRVAQLKRRFPHLQFESIRGNLNTRLQKLEKDGKYDAIILAAAGVVRMGWKDKISQYLDYEDCMYAVGQGALAIECREGDSSTLDLLSPLNDQDTLLSVTAERAFMKSLEGGCSVPLAVQCEVKDTELLLSGGVWSLDGSEEVKDSLSVTLKDSDDNVKESENGSSSSSPRRKILKVSPTIYCGLVSPKDLKKEMRIAYDLGVKLATIFIDKGAKSILESAKAANNNQTINLNPRKEQNGNQVKTSS